MKHSKTTRSSDLKLWSTVLLGVILSLIVVMLAGNVMADSGSDIFGDIQKLLEDYMKGKLGVVICLLVIIVGAVQAIRTGQVFFVIIAVGLAIILYYSPTAIENLMDDTLADVTAQNTAQAAQPFLN